jgi:hypothetical protein
MSISAANPAGLRHVSLCMVERSNKSLARCNDGVGLCGTCGGHASPDLAAAAAAFRSQCADANFAPAVSAVMYPIFCTVTASGPIRRPSALGLLLRAARPFGVSVLLKTRLRTTAKNSVQTSFGPLPESRPSALGSRAHSLSCAQCDPSNNGQIQQTETPSCTRTK